MDLRHIDVTDFVEECRATIARARALRAEEPDANPVRFLAYRISRRLESGEIAVETLAGAAKAIADAAFRRRAARLAAYARPVFLRLVGETDTTQRASYLWELRGIF